MINLVPATPEILAAHYPEPLPQTVRAIAAVKDGRVMGIAGFYHGKAGAVVFADLSDELRKAPRVLINGARWIFSTLKDKRFSVFAKCDERIEAAERFLLHLGFKRIDNDFFEWQPRSRT